MLATTRIAIIGAGPAGLLLARKLLLRGMPFTLFDRDLSPTHRAQGGMLDLHAETGQYALHSAGLLDAFKTIARYEDQDMRLLDQHGSIVFEKQAGAGGDRPEVDRGQLRDMLLRSLPEASVCWGHALQNAVKTDHGAIALRFGNGNVECFDYVVGADGAWSRVRPLLSAALPAYSGITMYELSIPDADARHPALARFVGRGTLAAKGDRKTLFAQRNAHAHIVVYASLRQEAEEWQLAADAETRESLLARFAGWDARLLQLFLAAQKKVRPWPIHALPVGHRWEHCPGATLLGDAAHLMPPAGEGANLALRDAADLADALTSGRHWLAAVRAHENNMFDRAARAATRAMKMLVDGAAEGSLEKIRRQLESENSQGA